MSSRRIFGLTLLAFYILSFRPSFGIYPLVIGPEVDLEMVADLQLIEEGMNGKSCGLALFVCGSSALCSSAVLFSNEYVLTSTRSLSSFGLLDHGKGTGISYLPSNTKGIVIFKILFCRNCAMKFWLLCSLRGIMARLLPISKR